MRRTLVVVLLVAACRHKPAGPPPDCKTLAPHMDAVMQTSRVWHSDDPLPRRLDRWQGLCEEGHFSEAKRQCLAEASTVEDTDACPKD